MITTTKGLIDGNRIEKVIGKYNSPTGQIEIYLTKEFIPSLMMKNDKAETPVALERIEELIANKTLTKIN